LAAGFNDSIFLAGFEEPVAIAVGTHTHTQFINAQWLSQ